MQAVEEIWSEILARAESDCESEEENETDPFVDDADTAAKGTGRDDADRKAA